MAVMYTGGGKDFFSSILPLVGMLVPGAGPWVAGAYLLNGLIRGDAGQAAGGGLGLFGRNLFGGGEKDPGLVPMKGNEANNPASVPIGTEGTMAAPIGGKLASAAPSVGSGVSYTPPLTVQDVAGAAGVSPDIIVANMIGTGLADQNDPRYYPNWQRSYQRGFGSARGPWR